ncbi:GNAT family N-acetyltransferase [Actinoplanes sp. NPDC026670]|uniref:GNAT family N-acetyltransferase n=1 Tax=Actinoplanes sp. NPDC026670 TaxID=3154700 RepID=UPI00340D1F11
MIETGVHILDQAAWASLTGPHACFAQGGGRARRYRPEISPIMAIPPVQDEQAWADLHTLVGRRGQAFLSADIGTPPDGWAVDVRGEGVQLLSTAALRSEPFAGQVVLGAADVPEMLELVARTKPGPFEPETYRLGTYLGVRRAGRLVAMAGERLHPPGYTEISAVCTDPDFRGLGLGSALVRAVAHNIRERGEIPFMHAAASNVNAIRLYLSIGFELRRTRQFTVLTSPDRNPQDCPRPRG